MSTQIHYTARADGPAFPDFLNFLRHIKVTKLIVNREDPGDNPHHHLSFLSDKKESALKQAKTRFFKTIDSEYTGNRYISISLCRKTTEEYLQYMCKGFDVGKPYSKSVNDEGIYIGEPFSIIINESTYTHEQFQEFHEQFWSTYLLTSENYEKHLKKKRSQLTFTENLINGLMVRYKEQDFKYVDHDFISSYIVESFCDATKVFDKFILRRIYNIAILKIEKYLGKDTFTRTVQQDLIASLREY